MTVLISSANSLRMGFKFILFFARKVFFKLFLDKKNIDKKQNNKTSEIISIKSLISKLEEHGITSQDTLMIHSSYKALGKFTEKPHEVINELKNWMKDGGTLLFPTFTMASNQYKELCKHSEFDLDNLKITTGVLPHFASNNEDFQRSFHPTHSVVGFGKHAIELLKDHGKDGTIAGPTSPFYKMMQYNGKILNLGVNLETTTAVHIVEQVPGVYFPIRTSYKKKFNVKVTQKGCSQNLEILSLRPNLFRIRKVEYLRKPLQESGALKEIKFGDGKIDVIDCNLFYETLQELSNSGKTIYGKWF